MRLDISKYEVINSLDNIGLIGYLDNIIKLYKDYLKQLVDDISDDVVCNDLKYAIDEVLELLHKLYLYKLDNGYIPLIYVTYDIKNEKYEFKVLVEEVKENE